MDGSGAWKRGFPVEARSLWLALAACSVSLVFLFWSLRQSHLAQEALARAIAAEQAAAHARADAQEARAQPTPKPNPILDEAVIRAARRARDRDPNGAERVRQLSEEIDGLTRVQAQVQEELQTLRVQAARAAAAAAAAAATAAQPRAR